MILIKQLLIDGLDNTTCSFYYPKPSVVMALAWLLLPSAELDILTLPLLERSVRDTKMLQILFVHKNSDYYVYNFAILTTWPKSYCFHPSFSGMNQNHDVHI